MNDLPGSFGKFFLASGFIPSLIFIGLNDFVILPLFYQRYLIDIKFLGLEGGIYILLAIILGLILLGLNILLIRLYQVGLLPIVFRKRYLQKHKNLYTALNSQRKAYQTLKNQGENFPKDTISQLEGIHSILEKRDAKQRLPHDSQYIMPTSLGNAFAVMAEYPYYRYGMDISIYWQRLTSVIPTEYYDKITDKKAILDFFVNLSFLLIIFGIEGLIIGLLNLNMRLIIYGGITFIIAWLLYRAAVETAFTLGEWVKGCFDIYRADLLKKIGIETPKTLEEEREIWLRLGSFILRGEDFYYTSLE